MADNIILNPVLSAGDPAGIGPEIVARSLHRLVADSRVGATKTSVQPLRGFILCAPRSYLDAGCSLVQIEPETLFAAGLDVWDPFENRNFALYLPLLQRVWPRADSSALLEVAERVRAGDFYHSGRVSAVAGRFACISIAAAAWLCSQGQQRAMVTPPIHKQAVHDAGIVTIGHTEMIADMLGTTEAWTMFKTGAMRIFFHSRHVSLRQAIDLITVDRLLKSIRAMHQALLALGIQKPRLACAALNPHGGEGGRFGDEELLHICPALEAAQAEGIDIHGPIGADTIFWQARQGEWDAVLSLYHDQGHIAAKTSDFDRTISFTLGYGFLRSSVDHGPAFDIAGTGRAREISMLEAIKSVRSD